jgi:ribosomal subunit interface protein
MNIQITSQSIDIEEVVKKYIEKSLQKIKVLAKDSESLVTVIATKNTNHQKKGDIYSVELVAKASFGTYHSIQSGANVKIAFNKAVLILEREVYQKKEKKSSLFKKGAQRIKQLLQSR